MVTHTEGNAKVWVLHHEDVRRQGGTELKTLGSRGCRRRKGRQFWKPRKDSFMEESAIRGVKLCSQITHDEDDRGQLIRFNEPEAISPSGKRSFKGVVGVIAQLD